MPHVPDKEDSRNEDCLPDLTCPQTPPVSEPPVLLCAPDSPPSPLTDTSGEVVPGPVVTCYGRTVRAPDRFVSTIFEELDACNFQC